VDGFPDLGLGETDLTEFRGESADLSGECRDEVTIE